VDRTADATHVTTHEDRAEQVVAAFGFVDVGLRPDSLDRKRQGCDGAT
jgi:hypothetical protein